MVICKVKVLKLDYVMPSCAGTCFLLWCVDWLLLQGIYPLQNVAIRKVKVLKAPKFDLTKLMEVHGDYTEEVSRRDRECVLLLCYMTCYIWKQ
jgi:hypothetical protein